jgi:ubiquinone/menaquinone biosynthesis C-methylase UbiE
MLAIARAMPQRQGVAIEWREGNATGLPFPDASFDRVCCQQELQFFPDRPAALQEMCRVLVPGDAWHWRCGVGWRISPSMPH